MRMSFDKIRISKVTKIEKFSFDQRHLWQRPFSRTVSSSPAQNFLFAFDHDGGEPTFCTGDEEGNTIIMSGRRRSRYPEATSSLSSKYEGQGIETEWGMQIQDARPILPKASFFLGDLRDGLPMVRKQQHSASNRPLPVESCNTQ